MWFQMVLGILSLALTPSAPEVPRPEVEAPKPVVVRHHRPKTLHEIIAVTDAKIAILMGRIR